MSKSVRIVIFVAVIVAAVLTAYFASKYQGLDDTSKEAKEDERFAPAERGDIQLTIKATGMVEPKTRVRIKSEASGKIEMLYIKEGQDVVPGDVIAELDQSNQRLNLKSAQLNERLRRVQLDQLKKGANERTLVSLESNVETAKLALEKAEEYLASIEELYKKEYATEHEYNDAKRGVENAKLALAEAEAQLELQISEVSPEDIKASEISLQMARVTLEEAQKNMGDAIIKCPIKGTVLAKYVEVGDTVISSTGSFGEGTTLCEIADLTLVQIRASVDEIDIGRVEIGQKVIVEVDAYPLEQFEGVVENVFQQGESAGGVTSFTVIVQVDNSDRRLLSAMTASVEIIADTVTDVVLVPYDVVRTDDELGTIVYVKGEDAKGRVKPEKREVKLGVTDYDNTEIMEGLEEGELVMVEDVPQSTTKSFGGQVKVE
ncbi:efflux RND transporter periplasmic adaptor subunit [bacterium]|nr:efflux RND transporter periplasmic adaptor subunit [bacterium]